MNIERTVKWIDKTGITILIQMVEISFVKLFSMLVGSSNIVSMNKDK